MIVAWNNLNYIHMQSDIFGGPNANKHLCQSTHFFVQGLVWNYLNEKYIILIYK